MATISSISLEMEAYDELPQTCRHLLANSPISLSAIDVYMAISLGEHEDLKMTPSQWIIHKINLEMKNDTKDRYR